MIYHSHRKVDTESILRTRLLGIQRRELHGNVPGCLERRDFYIKTKDLGCDTSSHDVPIGRPGPSVPCSVLGEGAGKQKHIQVYLHRQANYSLLKFKVRNKGRGKEQRFPILASESGKEIRLEPHRPTLTFISWLN